MQQNQKIAHQNWKGNYTRTNIIHVIETPIARMYNFTWINSLPSLFPISMHDIWVILIEPQSMLSNKKMWKGKKICTFWTSPSSQASDSRLLLSAIEASSIDWSLSGPFDSISFTNISWTLRKVYELM